MNRNIIVILFVVIIGGGIAALAIYANQFIPKYEWNEDLDKKSEKPYGLNLFYKLLEKQDAELVPVSENFYQAIDTNLTNSNYVVFASYLYMDSLKAEHLLKFVHNGNNAILSVTDAPIEVLRPFVPTTDTVYNYRYTRDSIATIDFTKVQVPYSQKLLFHYQSFKDTIPNDWTGYRINYFNDTLSGYGMNALSYLNGDYVNCFYVNHGKGKIIFHSNPILLTNYNIIQRDGFKHANNILSQLNTGPIYWDETSNRYSYDNGNEAKGNPLQFLFSDYRLRWAWYLFLATVLFYIVFRSKREQRIIPILPKNTNSSIEYIKAIGVLYFQKGKHKIIGDEMYMLFMADIRNRYHFSTQLEEEELIEKIIIRSEIQREKIEELFKNFRTVRFSPIAKSKDLINLHHSIEFYNKNSK